MWLQVMVSFSLEATFQSGAFTLKKKNLFLIFTGQKLLSDNMRVVALIYNNPLIG